MPIAALPFRAGGGRTTQPGPGAWCSTKGCPLGAYAPDDETDEDPVSVLAPATATDLPHRLSPEAWVVSAPLVEEVFGSRPLPAPARATGPPPPPSSQCATATNGSTSTTATH